MSTSSFLRVKRRLEDNPQDAFVLLCNRMKTDTEEISAPLFVMRGAVESPVRKKMFSLQTYLEI